MQINASIPHISPCLHPQPRTTARLRVMTSATLALMIAAASGCDQSTDPAPLVDVREGEGSSDYAWGTVELVTYDHAGGILPCVHVGSEIFEYYDVDELLAFTRVSYEDPETGETILESFEIPLTDVELTQRDGEVELDFDTLQLEAAPDEETIAVTVELTTDPGSLPDYWWGSIEGMELNPELGIVPCVKVARSAYSMSAVNELSMAITASYEDEGGNVFMDQWIVPLSSTDVMSMDEALLVVEPPSPLEPTGEVVGSSLVLQASLSWE